MKDYQIILEQAAFAGHLVDVKTKSRGIVTGEFTGVDEYETDDTRLGYCIQTGEHEEDTVFIDEIIDIVVLPKADEFKRAAV
ncbi:MAG: hypothetical protein FWD34_09855 [Oscillospiraceae bacterium]|nr:hypothetical protein [Oscillospiraceae bacterium]